MQLQQDEIIDRDEVLKMARQAGFELTINQHRNTQFRCFSRELEYFAKLVADVATSKEREVCAQICDDPNRFGPEGEWCASVIRARGESK